MSSSIRHWIVINKSMFNVKKIFERTKSFKVWLALFNLLSIKFEQIFENWQIYNCAFIVTNKKGNNQ